MVRARLAGVGLGVLLAGAAAYGQTGQSQFNPFLPPGKPIGKPMLNPVGSKLPPAAPPAGTKIGSLLPKPSQGITPKLPSGSMIDYDNVVAPVAALPGQIPQMKEPNLLERVYQKLTGTFGYYQPSLPQRPTYTPGISRRNRERREARMFVID